MLGNSVQSTGKLPAPIPVAGRDYGQSSVHRGLLLMVALSMLLVFSSMATAVSRIQESEVTIQFLITYVKDSNVVFERNFMSYSATEAAEHIEKKYQHFKNDIDTPEKFIELCATRSLMTGKLYLVVTEQGEKIPAGEWLNSVLAAYRLQDEQVLVQPGNQG